MILGMYGHIMIRANVSMSSGRFHIFITMTMVAIVIINTTVIGFLNLEFSFVSEPR